MDEDAIKKMLANYKATYLNMPGDSKNTLSDHPQKNYDKPHEDEGDAVDSCLNPQNTLFTSQS